MIEAVLLEIIYLLFIWLSCRNYCSICLNYNGYNFNQVDNKKTLSLLTTYVKLLTGF